jgi:phosphoserine phosphatase RsbU/P
MTSLVVTTPDGQMHRHHLTDSCLHIGRSVRNELVIEDPAVSRIHAEVVRRPEGYCLIDRGARGGILLNDHPIAGPAPLQAGDRIRIGRTTLVVDEDSAPAVDITPTPIPPGATMRTPEDLGLAGASTPATPPGIRAGVPSARPGGGPAPDTAGLILEVVLEADRQMLFHRPLEAIFGSILDLAERTIGYERAALMLLENGSLVAKTVRTPPAERGLPIALSGAIVERVLARSESILTSDVLTDRRFRASRSLMEGRIRSVMCVPLRTDDRVIGLLYLDSRKAAGLFTDRDLNVLAHLASVAAVKIENARLFDESLRARTLETEMLQAAAIVDHLLPAAPPAIPGYQVFGRSVACRHVGGDSYDYIALSGGRHLLTLGDVAGKGLPAALLMCCFHSTLRALAAGDLDESRTMRSLNRLLYARFPPNRFTTCFLAVLDPARHCLTYVNAGQETPYLLRRSTGPQPLASGCMPLGMFDDSEYTARRILMEPGDALLCYSDGVTEGLNPAGEMFGRERMLAAAARAAGGPAAEIAGAIASAIEQHHSGRAHDDDITLLVVTRS